MKDEYSSLQGQLDMLIAMQREQTQQLHLLQEQFHQAKGALALLKWSLSISIGMAGVIVAFWDVVHRLVGR